MLQIQAIEKKCIDLGRRGEDSAREILFDITGFAELYGQGEARVIAKRDRDSSTYPVEITQNHTTVSWVVKPVDNDQPGYGNCELVYITNGAVVKSTIYQTHVDESLSDPVSPPDSPTTYGSLKRDIGDVSELKVGESSDLVSALNSFYGQFLSSISPDVALESLDEVGIVNPMLDESNSILTDEDGNLFIF